MAEKGCNLYGPSGKTGKAVLLLVNLVGNGQLRAAFGAAAGDQFATTLRAHTATETMLVDTTALGGLERSFHYSLFLAACRAGRKVR